MEREARNLVISSGLAKTPARSLGMGRTEKEPSSCIAHWSILWVHCESEHWEQASAPPGRWTANPESSCPGQATGWPHTSQVLFPTRHLPENCARQHLLHCSTEAHLPPSLHTGRSPVSLGIDTPHLDTGRAISFIRPSQRLAWHTCTSLGQVH